MPPRPSPTRSCCRRYWTTPEQKEELFHSDDYVSHSFYNCCRYHLGSAALGSLIISIVNVVRVVVHYLVKQTGAAQKKSVWVKAAVLCLQCCLWCFSKFVEFVSKMSYIIVAVEGKSFCRSAQISMKLLYTFHKEVAVVQIVTTACLYLGKLGVTVICTTAMSYILYDPQLVPVSWLGADGVQSPFFPLVATAVAAYYTADLCFSVYELTIDTILISYCEDVKMNSAVGDFYMPPRLKRFMTTKAYGHAQARRANNPKHHAELFGTADIAALAVQGKRRALQSRERLVQAGAEAGAQSVSAVAARDEVRAADDGDVEDFQQSVCVSVASNASV